ncbi:AAA family ATPase [Methanoregula sp.]|uniref:AAA family ATPase n=1 Tax=Methanoregula sp. TaxID=2052170 RepID=UPI00237351C2|nr:AAA family ATPase [Methanoregula sp.]MDD1687114.1 ATP-binding protein [Methanoregula sp.]
MKIEIQNLGAAKRANIDLKPLTVFIGENNTGKTWVAYTICGLFGQESWLTYRSHFSNGKLKEKYPPIEQLLDQLFAQGNAKIDIVDFFNEYAKKYYSNLSKFSPIWLNPMMGTNKKIFEDVKISVNISDDFEEMKKNVLSRKIDLSYPKGTDKKGLINIKKNRDETILYFYFSENRSSSDLPKEVIRMFVYGSIFQVIHRSLYIDNLYLPAERTGIMAFLDAFHIDKRIVDNSKEEKQTAEDERILPFPISKLISSLASLQSEKKLKKITHQRTNNSNKKFLDLADILEKQVLGGKFEYKEGEGQLSDSLYYRHGRAADLDLELAVTSSTVKDLAPLTLYLRYLIQSRDLLLIDEPEMNLHPENQAKLMEFLVMLVQNGVSVIMVTHSPYMVNHLENLMRAYPKKTEEKVIEKFYLKNSNAFISKEDVSVYLFTNDNENVEKIIDKKGNINLKSFSSVAEDIAEIYYDV